MHIEEQTLLEIRQLSTALGYEEITCVSIAIGM